MRLPEKEKGWLMTSYIIRRICISLLTVFIISVFAFSIMHILPGDPVKIALGEGATQEMIDEYRAKLYLDRPIIEQYFIWIRNILLHGDYGTSIMYAEKQRKRIVLEGDVPSPIHAPSGCPFHPRCPYATDSCRQQMPALIQVEANHRVACHNINM